MPTPTTNTRPRDLSGRLHDLSQPAVVAVVAAAATAYVGVVDPNEAGHFPTCPFLALTGLFCPGCGTLRAVHALTRGDLAAAAGLNVLALVALPVLAVGWLLWTRRLWLGHPLRRIGPPWAPYALLVGVAAFWVARNLAVGQALAP